MTNSFMIDSEELNTQEFDYECLDFSMLKSHPNYEQFEDYDRLFWEVSNEDKYLNIFQETRKAIVKELENIVNDCKETLKRLNKPKLELTVTFNNVDECVLHFYFLVANNFRNSINFSDIVNPYKLISTFFDKYDYHDSALDNCYPNSEFVSDTSLLAMNNDYELLKRICDDMLKNSKLLIDEVKKIDELVSQINTCFVLPDRYYTQCIRQDYGFLD